MYYNEGSVKEKGECGVRKKICLGAVIAFCVTTFALAGCQKNNQVTTKKPPTSSKPAATEVVSSEVLTTEDAEVPSIDIDALEELKGIALSAEEKAHNLYKGMFGDEEVILDLWYDKEANEAQITFVGAYRAEKHSFSCELLGDGIRFHDDRYYILLKQQKDDALKGYFYERKTELKDVDLTLESINYTEDKEHLYTIGSNEAVEEFAQKVLDSINGYDFKAFSSYVSFPITVHVNQAIQTIETKEGFEALGDEVIFTDGFVASMAVTYPNLMFGNTADGVMLGDGQYNVWINLDENGNMKVTAINN